MLRAGPGTGDRPACRNRQARCQPRRLCSREVQDRMKKIVSVFFLLAAFAAAGRAQESRQDISISGNGLIEPFIASSTDVQVHSNCAFGALASYRFMLTPSSALEANYGITYQNKIRYIVGNTNIVPSADPHPGNLRRLRAQLYLQEVQSVCEAWPSRADFPAHPQHRDENARREAADRSAACTAPASLTRSAPASTSAPSIAGYVTKVPTFGLGSSTTITTSVPTSGTTSLNPTIGVAYHF